MLSAFSALVVEMSEASSSVAVHLMGFFIVEERIMVFDASVDAADDLLSWTKLLSVSCSNTSDTDPAVSSDEDLATSCSSPGEAVTSLVISFAEKAIGSRLSISFGLKVAAKAAGDQRIHIDSSSLRGVESNPMQQRMV